MAASMQGVIEKLRAQENELARLHRARAGTRTGIRTHHRRSHAQYAHGPAARQRHRCNQLQLTPQPKQLWASPLRYRSYKEILGEDSDLSQMLTACLREGKTISARRSRTSSLPSGDVRHLGVTISPIYRAVANAAVRT